MLFDLHGPSSTDVPVLLLNQLNKNLTPVIAMIGVPFIVLTFEVNREFKQPTFLSDACQPEVSLFLLLNMPWQHQIFIVKCFYS